MQKDLTVIFDLDGTLLNTDLLIKKSFEHVFKQYKPDYQLSENEYLSFLGPSLLDTFQRYFPTELCEELIGCYRDYNCARHEDFVTLYPKVIETLEVLKNMGYPLAVVTTKLTKDAFIGLDLFSMREYFDFVIGVDSVKLVKPDPEGICYVLERTNSSKAVMIGDNTSDILAGKNANVYTIGVNWSPKGTKEMEGLHPDLMINRMDEIIDFIERID